MGKFWNHKRSPTSVSPKLLLRLRTLRNAFVLPRLAVLGESKSDALSFDDLVDESDVRLDEGVPLTRPAPNLSVFAVFVGLLVTFTLRTVSFFGESTIQLSAATALATRPIEFTELIDEAGEM